MKDVFRESVPLTGDPPTLRRGGNITLVGSTANIVALGILEKEKNIRMTFFRWFWVGLTVGVATTIVVWIALVTLPMYH